MKNILNNENENNISEFVDATDAVLKGKLTALNVYIREKGLKSAISALPFKPRKERAKQTESRIKEVIKTKVRTNEIEKKKTIERIK